MKAANNFKAIAISMLVAVGLAACDKPGPAETAGKKLDQTAENAGKKISEAADKVGDKMSEESAKAGVAMDNAGKKMDETVDKVGDKVAEESAKTGVAIDDAEITTKVKAAIFAEPGLKTLQISVDTVKGVVTLTGSVNSKESSAVAKSLAGAVAGVKEVKNLLVVKPA